MKITLAQAMGTCFGVQDAIDMALDPAFKDRLTIVGQLVHNPQTTERLKANGVRIVERDQVDQITTEAVMITAHGASDGTKQMLRDKGFTVYDATCPLVIRLHKLARFLEREGYFPVVIGEASHVEVRGVVGNLRSAVVVHDEADIDQLQGHRRIGVVSQTTNRPEMVQRLLAAIRAKPWVEDMRFCDTICQPVKERQQAIEVLLGQDIDLGIVIGGRNSANTRKLQELIADRGIEVHHIEDPEHLEDAWFVGKKHVGITAGTSTPQDVIEAVHARVRAIIAAQPAA
ncbi:MAG: 4-hydroxy-3-methylbut-2-enyl diphosphate reductase [Planctomycetes bacterium]|jgi:4-hydroxy-3-methylbut-2-enyl diphosphate reductase|nr:4-hydroxy-3-methylbut-2-enyl diphosphate reductase [Planctomycetota bacterium]